MTVTATQVADVPPGVAPGRAARLLSLDVLRGLDVLLMLFVNEMSGVRGTPAFLLHVPAGHDGMTLTDVVFPAFLFITGMAIPLALGARLRRHEPRGSIWRHVVTRSLALIVIGVFMVNAEHGSAPPPFPVDVWNVLMTCAVLMVWQTPAGHDRSRTWIAVAGVVLLAIAAFTYRSADADGLLQLRPQWWGILGLIGWAYLVGATVYLIAGDRALVLAGASAALYGLYFADDLARVSWLMASRPYIHVGSVLGSHAALVTSGAALTVMLRARAGSPARVMRDALGFAAAMAASSLVLHQFKYLGTAFWISKPLATPAWCLMSAAITAAAWLALYFVIDVKGWRRFPPSLIVAGENALLAYLLAPLLLSLFALSATLSVGVDWYGALGRITAVGWIRSIAFAWLVVRLCGWLRARGLRLQL